MTRVKNIKRNLCNAVNCYIIEVTIGQLSQKRPLMIRLAILISVLSLGAIHGAAQIAPMFQFTPSTINTKTNMRYRHWAAECIYYPRDFPGMTKGTINNVYIRAGKQTRHLIFEIYGLKIRMKNTQAMAYPHGGSAPAVKDSLLIGRNGNLVANHLSLSPQYQVDSQWIQVPLNVASFSYSGLDNIVVQISADSFSNTTLLLSDAGTTAPAYRMIETVSDSVTGISVADILDIGFDIGPPTSASVINNFKSVGLFPNPSTDGRFNIFIETRRPVLYTSVTVTDAIGRTLFSRHYDEAGTSISRQIELAAAAKGVYFVKIEADGDLMVRRVTIE